MDGVAVGSGVFVERGVGVICAIDSPVNSGLVVAGDICVICAIGGAVEGTVVEIVSEDVLQALLLLKIISKIAVYIFFTSLLLTWINKNQIDILYISICVN